MAEHYDVIVVGAGGVGSAAMWRLAQRGAGVLGLDRYPPAHQHGSSHGQTRAIRQAYFEHPDYVPLLRLAYQGWAELEQASGRRLFDRVGLLEVGPEDGQVIPGVLRSAAEHQLDIDRLTVEDARGRFPNLRFFDQEQIVVENNAGLLHVEQCVQQQLLQAQSLGAQWRQETVRRWSAAQGTVEVVTERQTYRAQRLVLAGGSWAPTLLAHLRAPLQVLRKFQFWRRAPAAHQPADRALPVFFFEESEGFFYGFPQLDERGIKLAEHSGGQPIDAPSPRQIEPCPQELSRLEQFARRRMPQPPRTPTTYSACYYTMTPDGHFLVDRDPRWPQVVFAAGLSGHGFKFAPVLGEALSELALNGSPLPGTHFWGLGRFDPSA